MAAAAKSKSCFVVGPIGSADSPERIHSDWVLEEIILPVFDAHFADFAVTRADKISKPGSINEQIISALLNSDLVIADLTTLNANCFYEIGIRHVVQKPIIHMHETGQHIPFDIAPFRSIEFSRVRPADIRAARAMLKDFIDTVLATDYVLDNPVTFSRGKQEFEKTATEPEKIIQDQLSAIINRLSKLELQDIDHVLPRNLIRVPRETNRKLGTAPVVVTVEALGAQSLDEMSNLASSVPSFFESASMESLTEEGFLFSFPDSPNNREAYKLFKKETEAWNRPVTVQAMWRPSGE